ncbi:flagellar FlbD family protein [bacterium]|nr:flagellar FlbD family protein [bacterium]MBU1651084.1 flagellar FlbD family protein [bacterium]MBU1881023.1 flagellar FlbD family protein [bacterium]
MIELTKLNGSKLVINSDLIEYIEALPDSLITMTTGMKIMVKENIPEIVSGVVEFRKRVRQEGRFPSKEPAVMHVPDDPAVKKDHSIPETEGSVSRDGT